MSAADTHRTIEAVWKMEAARVIAGLTRIVRDVGLAEDLAQEALVIALEKWPVSGIPQRKHQQRQPQQPRYLGSRGLTRFTFRRHLQPPGG